MAFNGNYSTKSSSKLLLLKKKLFTIFTRLNKFSSECFNSKDQLDACVKYSLAHAYAALQASSCICIALFLVHIMGITQACPSNLIKASNNYSYTYAILCPSVLCSI